MQLDLNRKEIIVYNFILWGEDFTQNILFVLFYTRFYFNNLTMIHIMDINAFGCTKPFRLQIILLQGK